MIWMTLHRSGSEFPVRLDQCIAFEPIAVDAQPLTPYQTLVHLSSGAAFSVDESVDDINHKAAELFRKLAAQEAALAQLPSINRGLIGGR